MKGFLATILVLSTGLLSTNLLASSKLSLEKKVEIKLKKIDKRIEILKKKRECYSIAETNEEFKKCKNIKQNRYFCPTIYKPVCATVTINHREFEKTFSNKCFMERHKRGKVTFLHEGKCLSSIPTYCPTIYKPVCASIYENGVKFNKTFSNSCRMKQYTKGKVTFLHSGVCSSNLK